MGNIKKLWIIFLAAVLQPLSCGPETVRVLSPVERYDVQIYRGNTGIIRTEFCRVSISAVGRDLWRNLSKSDLFSGGGRGFPSNPCFCIMILNTWDRPLQVSRIEVLSGGEVVTPDRFSFAEGSDYFKKRYAVNLEELWKTRRLLSDNVVLEGLDFDNETLEYRMNYIVPGDYVLFFSTFRWIRPEAAAKLRIGIKYHDMEKVIDFDLAAFEYYESEPGEIKVLREVKLK